MHLNKGLVAVPCTVRLRSIAPPPPQFRRGDTNGDGRADISDALKTLGVLFLGDPAASCADAMDANDDGKVDLSDAVRVLSSLFIDGTALPAPGIDVCGPDQTDDPLPECGYEPGKC